jgi:hypothetical protein
MAISGDYPHPVTVNGFSCKNCTDVDYAKKHIDPAHPKDGPYGVNAKDRASKTPFDKLDPAPDAKPKRVKAWADPGVLVDVAV